MTIKTMDVTYRALAKYATAQMRNAERGVIDEMPDRATNDILPIANALVEEMHMRAGSTPFGPATAMELLHVLGGWIGKLSAEQQQELINRGVEP